MSLTCEADSSLDIYPPDPFGNLKRLPKSSIGSDWEDGHTSSCAVPGTSDEVNLYQAAVRALCTSPKTRQAWARAKVQASQLGIDQAGVLPSITGTAQKIGDRAVTEVVNQPFLSSANSTHYKQDQVSLSWLLFDWGAQRNQIAGSQSMLDASLAERDASVQDVIIHVSADYFEAETALAQVDADQISVDSSREILKAASARVGGGAAAITDQLQAETVLAQAIFKANKDRSHAAEMLGNLAIDMGFSPGEVRSIASHPATVTESESKIMLEHVDALLNDALKSHPLILAAHQKIEAAEKKVNQVRAEGLPKFSLVVKQTHNTQPSSPGLGLVDLPSHNSDRYIGLEMNWPIFEGFGRSYQLAQAKSNVELQKVELSDAEQQISQNLWKSYQLLKSAQANIESAKQMLDVAERSFTASMERYQHGVGNIIEILNAQGAQANAKQQWLQTLADMRNGRLQLLGSLGRLRLTDLR